MNTNTEHPSLRLDRNLLILCCVVLGLVIVYPTARLFVSAVVNWEWESVYKGVGLAAIRNTFIICILSVLTAGIAGSSLAFFVSRFHFPGRNTLAAIAYLPFALPPLVGTLSFYYLIGTDGFIPRIAKLKLGFEDFAIEGSIAILIIHTYSFMVFFYAMVSAALENMDESQIEAARTLGASRWRTFRKVTIPMLTPALLGASLLTFMSSGASFSAPFFFGDDFPYLSVQIFKARSQFNDGDALTLTVLLACLSLFGVFLFRSRRGVMGTASKGVRRPLASRRSQLAATVAAWSFVGLLITPHLIITWLSFVDYRAWGTEIFPRTLTLENYVTILTDPSAFRPIRNSLWMSSTAALACVMIGLPAAYLIGRNRRGGAWVNLMVMIPWALPGTVVAMNLITAFNDPWLPIYYPIIILPVAYFVRNIPLFTRILTASVTQFDATLLEAGQTLGASRAYCFRTLTLPLLMPALAAGTALVFAGSLGEFVASILLYTTSNIPISVQINEEWRNPGAGVGAALAYSVFLMILVTGTFMVARRFASRII